MTSAAATRPADRLLTATRWLGFVEGTSLLVLLLVAMPLKYLAGEPRVVEVVGMLHGVLFLLFAAAIALLAAAGVLPLKRAAFGLIASVVPFGPWLLDRRVYPLRHDGPPEAEADAG